MYITYYGYPTYIIRKCVCVCHTLAYKSKDVREGELPLRDVELVHHKLVV